MTEALITSLAKISVLQVISRTSVMRYKNTDKSLPQIARELNVDAVVEGTVQRIGSRLRISAQLVQACTDMHLWAECYERDLRNVLALQAEVAQAIAKEVQAKLTPQERAHIAQAHPVDPEAYEAYLKGRYHWNRRSGEGFAKAVQYFQQAIAKDPTYAAAYAGLAAIAHHFFGFYLGLMGRYEEGYTELTRAIRLDPQSSVIHWGLRCVYLVARRYDQAIQQFEKALELDPGNAQAQGFLGVAYVYKSMPELAITAMQKGVQLSQGASGFVATLGEAYAAAGHWDEARKILEQLRDASKKRYVTPYFVARFYAALGERDEALRCLQTGLCGHEPWMVLLKTDARLDALRSEPRFQDLLRRMNFPT